MERLLHAFDRLKTFIAQTETLEGMNQLNPRSPMGDHLSGENRSSDQKKTHAPARMAGGMITGFRGTLSVKALNSMN
jgi:hypothetical protein